MIANKRLIEQVCYRYKLHINEELEAFILQEFSEEQFPEPLSEEQLYFSIKELIEDCLAGKVNIRRKTPYERVFEDRELLRDMYIERLAEITSLINRIFALETAMEDIKQTTLKFDEEIPF